MCLAVLLVGSTQAAKLSNTKCTKYGRQYLVADSVGRHRAAIAWQWFETATMQFGWKRSDAVLLSEPNLQ